MNDSSFDDRIHAMHEDDAGVAVSSIDAVRCLYLAKVAAKHGHPEAARHWEGMAQRWLKKMTVETDRPASS